MVYAVIAFELDQPNLEGHDFASLFPIDSIAPHSLYPPHLLILIYTALDLALGIDICPAQHISLLTFSILGNQLLLIKDTTPTTHLDHIFKTAQTLYLFTCSLTISI
jgi:hypothetical protein